jgi:hypothetical protein
MSFRKCLPLWSAAFDDMSFTISLSGPGGYGFVGLFGAGEDI